DAHPAEAHLPALVAGVHTAPAPAPPDPPAAAPAPAPVPAEAAADPARSQKAGPGAPDAVALAGAAATVPGGVAGGGVGRAGQARRRVRAFTTHADESADRATGRPRKSCVWQSAATAEGDDRLWLTLRTAASTAGARRLLAEERDGAGEDAAPLSGLGEAAFAASGRDDAKVWFHVGNLVAEIRYETGRDRRDELALQAARWAHASIDGTDASDEA